MEIKDILECERVNLYKEDIKLINICAPNKRDPKYMKQNLVEWIGVIGNSTIVLKDTNNSLPKMSGSKQTKKKICKYIEDLKILSTNRPN